MTFDSKLSDCPRHPRVTLVSVAAGRSDTRSYWPHYGLVILATLLDEAGVPARVVDQAFLRDADDAFVDRIRAFRPDIVGVSVYTTHASRTLTLVDRIQSALPNVRLIIGGPHVTLYGSDLHRSGRFAAIVQGEAESVILDVIQRVASGGHPGLIRAEPTPGDAIPPANFGLAEAHGVMNWLPIQLSRGCPFNCSFCEVRQIASRRIRYRPMEVCLDELERNLNTHPAIHTVRIVDDCPALDRPRFKGFLARYLDRALPARIAIDNLRADTVDEELIELLKRCDAPHVCIAVESGNGNVFRMVDKGETLDDVVRAARIVKSCGLPLYLCFIVGLPGSTFDTEMDSLRLAKQLKADLIYWNMFLPHRNTRARDWFAEHGSIYNEIDHFSVPDYSLHFTEPTCESPEFPKEERIRA